MPLWAYAGAAALAAALVIMLRGGAAAATPSSADIGIPGNGAAGGDSSGGAGFAPPDLVGIGSGPGQTPVTPPGVIIPPGTQPTPISFAPPAPVSAPGTPLVGSAEAKTAAGQARAANAYYNANIGFQAPLDTYSSYQNNLAIAAKTGIVNAQ